MYLTTASLLLIVSGLTHAQVASLPDLSKLPECAQKSAVSGIGATNCIPTDITCICKSPAFIQAVGTQIAASCTPEDQKAALDFANSICQPLGVTVPSTGLDDGSDAASASASAAESTSASSTTDSPASSTSSAGPTITPPPYPVARNESNTTANRTSSLPFDGAASKVDSAVHTAFVGLLFALAFLAL